MPTWAVRPRIVGGVVELNIFHFAFSEQNKIWTRQEIYSRIIFFVLSPNLDKKHL